MQRVAAMRQRFPLLYAFLNWLLHCKHLKLPWREGKCFCPECGKVLIIHWLVIRCAECGARRAGRYCGFSIYPLYRCCEHCGESATRFEPLVMPAYYQLSQALLMVEEETDFLTQMLSCHPWLQKTIAWVGNVQSK